MPFVADAELLHRPAGCARCAARCRSRRGAGRAARTRTATTTTTASATYPCPAWRLVDPVADRARLHRAAHDVVEVHLARDVLVEEQAELVGRAVRSVTVALQAPCRERAAVDHRVGLVRRADSAPTRSTSRGCAAGPRSTRGSRWPASGRIITRSPVEAQRRRRPGRVAQRHVQFASSSASGDVDERSCRRTEPRRAPIVA